MGVHRRLARPKPTKVAVVAVVLAGLVAGCSTSARSAAPPLPRATTSTATSAPNPSTDPRIITTTAPPTAPLTTAEKCQAEVQSVKTAVLAYNVADAHTSTWPRSGDDLLFDPRPKPLLGREWMPALPTYVLLHGDGTAAPTISWKPDAPTDCTGGHLDLGFTP